MKKTIVTLSVVVFLGLGLMSLTTTKTAYKKVEKSTVLQDANAGKAVYTKVCAACHQPTGTGLPGAFPPLAKSDYLNADVNRAIKTVIKGLTGKVTVNGKVFNSAMPAQATLSDKEIADVLTYVYASWGNSKKKVTPAMVKAQRK
jgi:mono/diheme cytochrome c family protein